MDQKLNKDLLLLALKYSPWFIGIEYFLECILTCFNIQFGILSILFGNSILPLLVIILFSFSLNYCIWHRIPIYYAITNNFINTIDFYIGIPISNKWMLMVYLIIAGLFALIGSYIKNKKNVIKRNTKESTIRLSR